MDMHTLQGSGFLHIFEYKRTIYEALFPVTIHGRTVHILQYDSHIAGVIAIINVDIPKYINHEQRDAAFWVVCDVVHTVLQYSLSLHR
jgi:hypothetical protein